MDNIRPIKTEDDYNWAIAEITHYFESQPQPGSAEGDRFDVLATLIEAYEEKNHPIVAPDPVAAIEGYMEMAGLKQSDLANILGFRSRASEVLLRKRKLTMDMVAKITQAWSIPAEVLVQPYRLAQAGRSTSAKQPRRTGRAA
ncbi:MAG: type II toxin-antitoxin system HigA family antitoxin [Pseudorhodoplanes sp.]